MSIGSFFLAAIVGAVILFVWGFLAWAVLPLHRAFMDRFYGEREDAVRKALREAAESSEESSADEDAAKSGSKIYTVPGSPRPRASDPEKQKAIEEVFQERFRKGPVAIIVMRAGGAEPMALWQMGTGFLLQLASAFIATYLLDAAAGSIDAYFARALFVTGLGVLSWLVGHAQYWNWMYFPTRYTLSLLADALIGWALLGLWLAWIV